MEHDGREEYGTTVQGVEYHPPQEATRSRDGEGAPSTLWPRHTARPANRDGVQETMVVGKRVDWFTAAFKVDLDPSMIHRMHEEAAKWGRVAVDVGALTFEAKRMQTGNRLLLRNDDVALVIDPEGPERWTLQVDFSGSVMARRTVDEAVHIARTVAAAFGAVQGERVRRVDLCVDVGGFDVGSLCAENWIKPGRARLEQAEMADVEKPCGLPELRQYHRGQRLTGFTICPGNSLSAVVYDKREELSSQRPEKRDFEEGQWKANGWDGQMPVGRVEFRFRTDALHEMGCRDGLDAFRKKLDAMWQYAARIWVRCVLPFTASRLSRCTLHPAWSTVQKVKFVHAAMPVSRYRLRAGVSVGHALGAVLSLVGSSGRLAKRVEMVGDVGEVLQGYDAAALLGQQKAEALVFSRLKSAFARAADEIARELVEGLGPDKAAGFVLEREDATRARFDSFPGSVLRPARSWHQPRQRAA